MGMYFLNEATGRRYDVVKFDKAAGEVQLKGKYGQFTEKFDRAKFERMGYVLKQD